MNLGIRRHLKRIPLAAKVNAKWKCRGMKNHYEKLCTSYGTPSVLRHSREIAQLASLLWSTRPRKACPPVQPSVLFVGTDREQDYSGLVQALMRVSRLTIFEHAPGKHGQLWPGSPAEFEEARRHNGAVLSAYVDRLVSDGGAGVIVGQMWGLSMDWRALARAREKGMEIINIAMDDRHSFTAQRLADRSSSGTSGIAPFVSLSCTAAPECVAWYEAEGHRAVFFPEASDESIFCPGDRKEIDVCFVGARYGIREKLVGALIRAGVRVQAYGTGWPNGRIPTEEVPSLFSRSRIILGSGTIGHGDDFMALKLRDFDAAMSGSMYLTHYNPDLTALFEMDREIVTYRGEDDLVSIVRHFLESDREREAIGEAGRKRCTSEHTWNERVVSLLGSESR
jgi:spore maturation protein CgeB